MCVHLNIVDDVRIVGLFNYKDQWDPGRLHVINVTLLLYRNIFTHVVYLDQLLGACQVCISTGSWVPLIVH